MSSLKLAKIISLISSPFVVIPMFGLAIVANYTHTFFDFISWFGLFFVLCVSLPFAFVALKVKSGQITDIHVMMRGQRLEPFLLATGGAALLSFAYILIGAPKELFAMSVLFVVTGLLFTAITHFWKISIHAASYAGGVLMLAGLIDWAWLWLALFLPVVIWARLKRQRHDIWQALAAVLVISICVLVTLFLLRTS